MCVPVKGMPSWRKSCSSAGKESVRSFRRAQSQANAMSRSHPAIRSLLQVNHLLWVEFGKSELKFLKKNQAVVQSKGPIATEKPWNRTELRWNPAWDPPDSGRATWNPHNPAIREGYSFSDDLGSMLVRAENPMNAFSFIKRKYFDGAQTSSWAPQRRGAFSPRWVFGVYGQPPERESETGRLKGYLSGLK